MLSDHVNLQLKRGVKIIVSDPTKRVIEAETRNGEVISINAYHQTPSFRWPVPGEKWMVTEENGSWYLDGIYEQQIPPVGEKVQPGDTIITAGSGTIWRNVEGHLRPLKEGEEQELRVIGYEENLAAKRFQLAEHTSYSEEGETKHPFSLPTTSKARFIIVIFGISVAENYGEIILEGKPIAITERSGSVGATFRTSLTVVIPPKQECVIGGTARRFEVEGPAGEVIIENLWESVS